jgi:hypothetical protein
MMSLFHKFRLADRPTFYAFSHLEGLIRALLLALTAGIAAFLAFVHVAYAFAVGRRDLLSRAHGHGNSSE